MDAIRRIFDTHCIQTSNISFYETYSGLVNGEVGFMLCNAYFYQIYNESIYFDRCSFYLEELLKKQINNFSLGYGLAGLAWSIEQLNKLDLIDNKCEDWMKNTETQLEHAFSEMIANNEFDYFTGASGILNYFVNKKEIGQSTIRMAKLFIEKITEYSHNLHFCNGKTKDSNGNFIPVFNLGVPHGLTGTILLLLSIKEKLNLDTTPLILALTNKLFEFKQPDDSECTIPCFVGQKTQSTLAWCYGDLPVLFLLTKIINYDKTYIQQLNNLSSKTLNRADYFKNDLTLCHGITIVSYLYFKIWNLTCESSYYNAYLFWKNHSLEIWEECLVGFNTYSHHKDFFLNPSLFNGFSGFIIAHLTMDGKITNEWDSCMLF